jgi:hypothetical protein
MFACFSHGRGMAASDDGEQAPVDAMAGGAAGAQAQEQQQPVKEQLWLRSEGGSGVAFELDAAHRLLLVVRRPGAVSSERLSVTGVALPPAAAGALTLHLLTRNGRHVIELASPQHWAGLLAGVNASLLLAERPEAAQQLSSVPIAEVAWSSAVEGVTV